MLPLGGSGAGATKGKTSGKPGSGTTEKASGTNESAQSGDGQADGAGSSATATGRSSNAQGAAGTTAANMSTMAGTSAAMAMNASSGSGASAASRNGTGMAGASGGVTACDGHAGETVCDRTTLYKCGENASGSVLDTCMNTARCMAGVMTGKCGECDPGQYRCTGMNLEYCSPNGLWTMKEPCASAELCTQGLSNHSCSAMGCSANTFDCSSGMLRKCKTDLTGWDTGTTCEMKLCDPMKGKCNDCVPDSKTCEGTTLVTCNADGKATDTRCQGDTPYCHMGTMACVQCMGDSDCKSSNECLESRCDTSTGMCGTPTPKLATTPCQGGRYCDGVGGCQECILDAHCKDASLRCVLGKCDNRLPLELSVSLVAGFYTLDVAPGYELKVTATFTAAAMAGSSVSITGLGRSCTLTSSAKDCHGNLPSSTQPQTYTITGPSALLCFPDRNPNIVTVHFEDSSSASMCTSPIAVTIEAVKKS